MKNFPFRIGTIRWTYIVLPLIIFCGITHGDSAEEREKKRVLFLREPIFNRNRGITFSPQYLKNSASRGDAAITNLSSLPRDSTSPKLATKAPSSPRAAGSPGSKSVIPRGLAPHLPGVKNPPGIARDDRICGFNAFTKNYCYYKTGPSKWLLCTERWGNCIARDKSGCFAPETRLRLADGNLKTVNDIVVGDLLWNPKTKLPMRVKKLVVGPETEPLVEISSAAGAVRVTSKHPVILSRGLVAAGEVSLGDNLLDEHLRPIAVTGVRRLPVEPHQIVWNFDLDTADDDSAHYVLAEGIISGDFHLQQKLAVGTKKELP